MQQVDDVSSYAREECPRIHDVRSLMIYSSISGSNDHVEKKTDDGDCWCLFLLEVFDFEATVVQKFLFSLFLELHYHKIYQKLHLFSVFGRMQMPN